MSSLVELDKQITALEEQLVKLSDEREKLATVEDSKWQANAGEQRVVVSVLVKRLKARVLITGKSRKWWFTFGVDHPIYSADAIVIEGTYNDARAKMIERHGTRWAFQYESAEAAGVEEFGLKELAI